MRTIHTLVLTACLALPATTALADEVKTDGDYEHLFTEAAMKALIAADRHATLLSDAQFETLFAAAMARAAAEYDNGRELAQGGALAQAPVPTARP